MSEESETGTKEWVESSIEVICLPIQCASISIDREVGMIVSVVDELITHEAWTLSEEFNSREEMLAYLDLDEAFLELLRKYQFEFVIGHLEAGDIIEPLTCPLRSDPISPAMKRYMEKYAASIERSLSSDKVADQDSLETMELLKHRAHVNWSAQTLSYLARIMNSGDGSVSAEKMLGKIDALVSHGYAYDCDDKYVAETSEGTRDWLDGFHIDSGFIGVLRGYRDDVDANGTVAEALAFYGHPDSEKFHVAEMA